MAGPSVSRCADCTKYKAGWLHSYPESHDLTPQFAQTARDGHVLYKLALLCSRSSLFRLMVRHTALPPFVWPCAIFVRPSNALHNTPVACGCAAQAEGCARKKFFELFETYGTHYVDELVLGGKVVFSKKVKKGVPATARSVSFLCQAVASGDAMFVCDARVSLGV